MVEFPDNEDRLDNPVWHALRGPLSRFVGATSGPEWICFAPEVNVFSAVDRLDDAKWGDIAKLVGPEGVCALFRDVVSTPPDGWEEHFRGVCLQMIAADLSPKSDLEVLPLDASDATDMLALAELTEPGPFFSRTFELGRYVGVRRDGRLVAMAGERFRIPGFVEISGVCTHPDVRGEGLAAQLTLDVAESIRERGDEAFLHVLDTNENAVRLYQRLGFDLRRTVDVVFAQWHGTS
jgi:predicted GNAT family acetyltransferase